MDSKLVESAMGADRRRNLRTGLRIPVSLVDREGEEFSGVVLNLAPGGLLLVADRALTEREPLRLALPGLDWVRGKVVWALAKRGGVNLHEPLAIGEVVRLAQSYTVAISRGVPLP